MTFKAWSKFATLNRPVMRVQDSRSKQKTKVLFIRESVAPPTKKPKIHQENSKINLIKP